MSATQRLTRSNTLSNEDYLQSQVFLSKEQLAVQALHGSGLLRYNNKEEDEISDDDEDDLDLEQKLGCCQIIRRDLGMYIGHLVMGMTTALLGVTLLEIQTQTGADIDKISFLLTSCFSGCLLSSLLTGAVFDKVHPKFLFCVTQLVMSLVMLAIPWVKNYYLVSFLIFLQGISHGFLSTATNAHLFQLWRERTGPFLQALFFSYSIGSMLAPILAKPFLTVVDTDADVAEMNISNVYTKDVTINGSLIVSDEAMEQAVAISRYISTENSLIVHEGTFFPFLIVGLCQVPAIMYFFVQIVNDKCKVLKTTTKSVIKKKEGSSTNVILLVLFLILLFFPCGLETCFGGLLYTYVVKHHEWPVEPATLLLMTFWLTFAGSRALSIPIMKILKPETLLTISFSVTMGALILMATASHVTPLMWIATIMVGFALGPLAANAMAYAGTFMSISGRVASSFMASMFSSAIIIPICLGLLFKHFGMEWFVYINIVATGIMCVAFILIRIVGVKCYHPKNEQI